MQVILVYDLQINDKALILYDRSLEGAKNLSCGANQEEYHYTGLDMERELPDAEYHDFAKIQEGGICPHCGKPSITISRGIEVGNIFQLGTKYTRSMNMTYIDENGKTQYPVMGCYGIGVGRLVTQCAKPIMMNTVLSGLCPLPPGRFTCVQSAQMMRR